MRSANIKLSLTENVKTFVNIVSRYGYDVDLRSGRHCVDAKSLLGIFSLDLSKPIELNIHANDGAEEVLATLQPYLV